LSISKAVSALKAGDLVIIPTETVYGLAADAGNPLAVTSIYRAKDRPLFNPLIVHVADEAQAAEIVEFDERSRALADAFWPGALTIVAPMKAGAGVCDLARAGLDTVAVRAPSHPLARKLLEAFDGPIVAPSANRSGRPSPTTCQDAAEETGAFAAEILDGGPCEIGLESTVVGLIPGEPARLLRPGGITRAAIEVLIGPLESAKADARRSPGRLTQHYAPDAPVRLNAPYPLEGEAYLAFGKAPKGDLIFNLSPAEDLGEAAANLFAHLRAADLARPRAIAVAPIPMTGLGEAINDRLSRAAGHVG
jgi:L-threonylcarbamoyladenylate synthase